MARIFVVDDDRISRRLLEDMLTKDGHEVGLYEDAASALDAVGKDAPDILMTDIFMPEKNGLEMILELRRMHPDLKIIAVSGDSVSRESGYKGCLEVASCLGSSKVLEKPLSKQKVLDAVHKTLDS